MDEQWRNHEGGTEHGRRCNVDRGETARRIETKRLAALGIQLANADRAWKTNADCSRDGFTGSNTTSATRSRSRYLHDQPFAAGDGPSAVRLLGSTGCQPAVVGSLPTTLPRCKKDLEINVQALFGRLPKTRGWQPALPRVDH